ncbi:MAG: hypothetical protein H8D67_20535 [Deltaproteobacteria bacterium]|nr:hypothetical protein [Deltaproteobacteria bacterium]
MASFKFPSPSGRGLRGGGNQKDLVREIRLGNCIGMVRGIDEELLES